MATLVLLNNISVIPKFVKDTVISILKQDIMLVNSRKCPQLNGLEAKIRDFHILHTITESKIGKIDHHRMKWNVMIGMI